MINDKKTAHYREELLLIQKELVEALGLAEEVGEKVELDQARFGRVSRGTALMDQAMSEASVERDKKRLVAVRKALKRIEEGQYGFCLECDEPISAKRLEVAPETELCLDCQSFKEEHDRK
ncbi:TraR/DksA family transcriptional regulator [Kangiella koreensis]|uniref:Transcriptional regulator, TraR/DksA family n=1 Tax=Kangiella koreensis (strain DSM 16069 / JCM 12317 / KCTC 12182 / SW-125) TaxID=523791 RepID=C7R8Q8_KANKD|nr:TraR/DksA family transcriptional regulator [Kangiella koreensis]ACV25921.1 transcriptional regulator, TraR/DksA family [Kangiella koreensis DSM 16069]